MWFSNATIGCQPLQQRQQAAAVPKGIKKFCFASGGGAAAAASGDSATWTLPCSDSRNLPNERATEAAQNEVRSFSDNADRSSDRTSSTRSSNSALVADAATGLKGDSGNPDSIADNTVREQSCRTFLCAYRSGGSVLAARRSKDSLRE